MPISSGANGWPTSHTSNLIADDDPIVVVQKPSPVKVVRVRPSQPRPKPRDKSCCGGNGSCGPMALYTTGIAGANAGCCTGGLFSRRKYPYNPKNPYILKGNGCRRCSACVAGFTFAVAVLTSVLIGLLVLKPYIETQQAQNAFYNDPAMVYTDGVFYYAAPAVDYYYMVIVPYEPCRPDPTVGPTTVAVSETTVTLDTDTAGTATEPETTTTVPPTSPTTLPLCSIFTTGFSLLQRPTNPLPESVKQIQGGAAIHCGCAQIVAFMSIVAYVLIRQCMHV